MATDNDTVCEKLNDLIQLDFDAIDAYAAAIERLESAEYRQQLAAFMADHERHTENLAAKVRELGGTPKHKGDAMRILTKGKVVIGGLMGDKAILMAMKANEEVTNKTYEHMLEKVSGRPDVESLVDGNLGDERRHKAWIDATLERL